MADEYEAKLRAVRQSFIDAHWLGSPVQSVREGTLAEIEERERRELVEELQARLGYPPGFENEMAVLLAVLREGSWRKGAI